MHNPMPSSYFDSGASHHLTFNPNNLAYRSPYTGHEQVMMGNDQGVSIKSLGQSQISSPNNLNVHFKLNELLHVPNISKISCLLANLHKTTMSSASTTT
jgi:hypothetical protein